MGSRTWAERDRKRAETEAYYAEQREAHRQKHIAIVEAALRKGDPGGFLSPHGHAEIAVDALLADGVIFARAGGEGHHGD